MGAIDGIDLTVLWNEMLRVRPGAIVEIGCCTGLSTGLMALMLDQIAPGRIVSVDLAERVYFDETKPVGYLLDQIAPHRQTQVDLRTGLTALDLAQDGPRNMFDLAFVDASHQHPWPILDTLCLLPTLKDGAPILHHDLQLFRSRQNRLGVGPKILFDQVRGPATTTADQVLGAGFETGLTGRAVKNNIFSLRMTHPYKALALSLARGLHLPWSIQAPLPDALATRMVEFLKQTYPWAVAEAFETGMDRHINRAA